MSDLAGQITIVEVGGGGSLKKTADENHMMAGQNIPHAYDVLLLVVMIERNYLLCVDIIVAHKSPNIRWGREKC